MALPRAFVERLKQVGKEIQQLFYLICLNTCSLVLFVLRVCVVFLVEREMTCKKWISKKIVIVLYKNALIHSTNSGLLRKERRDKVQLYSTMFKEAFKSVRKSKPTHDKNQQWVEQPIPFSYSQIFRRQKLWANLRYTTNVFSNIPQEMFRFSLIDERREI